MAPTNRTIARLLAVVGIAALGAVAPVTAQKTAYVASDEIMNRLPEVKDARTRIGEMQATWLREIQSQETDIARLRAEIESNRLLWSTQERRDAEGRLRDAEQKLAAFRASKYDAGGEYEKLHNESLTPLYDKVFAAIAEEAKAQKYDFVFDKSSRGLPMLYASPDYDLTAAVLRRLGVKLDPSELEEAPADGGRAPQRGRRPADDPNTVLEEKPESTSGSGSGSSVESAK
ncbi:MAG TPA: OmpH family outer membrane protein [Candidatus Kapabacteria bacterium]|nr:OmpH family outer membrane protein [Candidatus Kapabacteria bacterium]